MEKKYANCPLCNAPCEVIEKIDAQDYDGDIFEVPYDEYNYHPPTGPTWGKDALTWAKESLNFVLEYIKVPEVLSEHWGNMYMNTLHAIDQALDESPAEQPIAWISSDTKPEHNVGVLVFIPGEDNHITSGMWDIENKWVLLDEYRIPDCKITHWMPLPAFPEGHERYEIPDELTAVIKEIARKEMANKSPEQPVKEVEKDPQELWDEHSALIGEDIDDLSYWSGREVMKKEDFLKALAEWSGEKEGENV